MAFDANVAVGGGHYSGSPHGGYDYSGGEHIAVGSGHVDSGYSTADTGFNWTTNKTNYIYSQNVPNPIILRVGSDDSKAWADRDAEQLDRAMSMAKEAGLMIGSARAGDLEGTLDHGINAAIKSAEIFVNDMKNNWNQLQDWFGKPDNDHSRPENDRNY
jgi:hypothetical protein